MDNESYSHRVIYIIKKLGTKQRLYNISYILVYIKWLYIIVWLIFVCCVLIETNLLFRGYRAWSRQNKIVVLK